MINNRQNGRRRGRGGQPPRNGQPGVPDRGSRLDNRARGNAAQLLEKYRNLARDSHMSGDRVTTEYYLQFADHYFRVLSETRSRFEENRPQRRDDLDEDGGDDRRFDPQGANQGWGDDEDDRPEPQPYAQQAPQARAEAPEQRRYEPRPPREPQAAGDGEVHQDEGERYQDRRPRRERAPAPAPRPAIPAPPVNAAPPREPVAERIEVDRLPQGFGTAAPVAADAADGDGEAPRPRRRARRPRTELDPAPAEA